MHVYNESASFAFYRAFDELLRNSTLRARAGTIVLSMDWSTMETCAVFTEPIPQASSRPVGRGRTANDLFAQVVIGIDPPQLTTAVPQTLEHPGPGSWWWLYFGDTTSNGGRRFLGVAVVEGRTLRHAMDAAVKLNISPGGKLTSVACTRLVPKAKWRNRLLTREEMVAMGDDLEEAD